MDDTPDELIRDWRPVGVVAVNTREDIISLVSLFGWSNIIWKKTPDRGWRRRMSGFLESTMVVVDIDEMNGKDEGDLVRICDDLGCPYLVITSKTRGRYRVLLWTERSMRTLVEHCATHGRYVELFGGDRSCKDGTDWYRPCRLFSNTDSARVVAARGDGCPLPIETQPPTNYYDIINTGAPLPVQGVAGDGATVQKSPTTNYDIINTGAPLPARTLEDVRRYAAIEGARLPPAGGNGRNDSSFRVFRNIAAMLNGIGLFGEALSIIVECNSLAPDPVCEAELMHAWRTIQKWRDNGTLWRSSKRTRRDGWVKKPTMSCACGCGEGVEQVQGKGRQRKWAKGHKPRATKRGDRMEGRTNMGIKNEPTFCGCGCGAQLTQSEGKGRPRKWVDNAHKMAFRRGQAEALLDGDRISVGGGNGEGTR